MKSVEPEKIIRIRNFGETARVLLFISMPGEGRQRVGRGEQREGKREGEGMRLVEREEGGRE